MAEVADVDIQPIARADFFPANVFCSLSMNTQTGHRTVDVVPSYRCFAMAKMKWMLISRDSKGTRKLKDGRTAVTELI